MITAIFPSLEILNGSTITTLERENSEIYYLARIVEGNDLEAHPLFTSLVKSPHPFYIPIAPPGSPTLPLLYYLLHFLSVVCG